MACRSGPLNLLLIALLLALAASGSGVNAQEGAGHELSALQSGPSGTAVATAAPAADGRQLTALLASTAGRSGAQECYSSSGCTPPGADWDLAARSTVLLLLANGQGARFCSGAVLNTPHLAAVSLAQGRQPSTYILLANHCLGFDSAADAASYVAVFRYSAACGTVETAQGAGLSTDSSNTSTSTSGGAVTRSGPRRLLGSGATGSSSTSAILRGAHTRSTSRRLLGSGSPADGATAAQLSAPGGPLFLQGLSVAWQDEATDVALLRLDTAIPPEWDVSYLGWNAAAWAAEATPAATISHPRGDRAQFAFTASGLQQARFVPPAGEDALGAAPLVGPTHYKLTWETGGSDVGSSGAPLLDASTQQALGVLTGGEPSTCHNMDLFGSLRAAWLRGLWQLLSPAGPEAVTAMPGAAQLAPAGGPASMAAAAPDLQLGAGEGAAPALPAQLVPITGSQQVNFTDAAALLWQPSQSLGVAALQLGQPLASLGAWPRLPQQGAAQLYSLTTSLSVLLDVVACSEDGPLQVAVFLRGMALWVSTQACSGAPQSGVGGGNATGCQALDGAAGCSGLVRLPLPGAGQAAPYTLAVLPLPAARMPGSGAPTLGAPAALRYDLHVLSHAQPPTYATVDARGSD